MILAKELRKQNIAEYLIYMFQTEDLIRSFKADFNQLYENHIKHYNVDEKTLAEIKDWYATFCKMMKEEGVLEKGHLQFIKNKMSELESFHIQLLYSAEENIYVQKFNECRNDLALFKEKSQIQNSDDVETAITALYMLLLMRLKKMEIKEETLDSYDRISNWMRLLAKKYHDFENGVAEH